MRNPRGMTILELMIVLAIIGAGIFLVRTGFRVLTKADLVDNSTELSAVLKRTSQLALEKGEMHRVVFDLDKQIYAVEMCQGARTLQRNESLRPDEETTKRALEKGKERLKDVPADTMAADPEAATKQALSVAGHHIADRMCEPVDDPSSDAEGKGWVRTLRAAKGIKFKEMWVQHLDDSVTKGQAAIYFFPTGSAEKAVVEITDGSETFTVLVSGLSGRVELKDGTLRDVNEHMLKNALGDKDKPREDEK
jgi:general secretion pathway protein H